MGAKFAKGTQLQQGDAATPEVFTTIPGVDDIEYTPPQPEEIDITSHSSPGNYAETYYGLMSGGQVSTEIFYDPSNAEHVKLRNKHGVTVARNYKLIDPSPENETVSFKALVKVTFTYPTKNVRKMKVTLNITADPSWS